MTSLSNTVLAADPGHDAVDVERELRERIMSLDIGPGERLTERWGEGRPGASRSPVRAALFRLEAEGLVRRSGRGWVVAPIDLEELEQIFVYREALEVAALRVTMATLDAETLAGVAELLAAPNHDGSRAETVRAGDEFHIRLALLSGNAFFGRGVADAMTRLARARWLEVDPRHHGWDEHRAITTAIATGNTDRAAERLSRHVRDSSARLLSVVRENRRSLRARGVISA